MIEPTFANIILAIGAVILWMAAISAAVIGAAELVAHIAGGYDR
jgi:hypothetical protein